MPQDERGAARLYRLSADQDDVNAQAYLGGCYAVGTGVPQDDSEAEHLFRLAADQGHASSQFALCERILLSHGETAVPGQLREGALLVARAAQQTQHADVRQMALARLAARAHERDVVHACCIGCGKAKGLKLCGRYRVAKWCGPECAKRMWPAHKACCKLWASV